MCTAVCKHLQTTAGRPSRMYACDRLWSKSGARTSSAAGINMAGSSWPIRSPARLPELWGHALMRWLWGTQHQSTSSKLSVQPRGCAQIGMSLSLVQSSIHLHDPVVILRSQAVRGNMIVLLTGACRHSSQDFAHNSFLRIIGDHTCP